MQIVILDRDGVINHDSDKFVKNADEFEIINGSIDAIVNLTQAGCKVIICTNQSGFGRGLFTMEDLNEIHGKLHQLVNQAGGDIAAILFCPHLPADNCDCRKPKPGMIIDICERFNVDNRKEVYLVGDSLRDLEAIIAFGGIPILVKTGNGKQTLANEELPEGTLVFDNLLKASHYIVERVKSSNAS